MTRAGLTPPARALAWALIGGLWLLAWVHSGLAAEPSLWQEDEQRLQVGLKIFPAVLGAIESLDSKYAAGGILQVLVVYQGSAADAGEAVRILSGVKAVRGLPLQVKALSLEALDQYRTGPVAGVFVVSTGVGGTRLRAWSERLQTLVFSPFAGDLEAGAVAGLYVADRVLPFIHASQARRAGLRFKPFFLKVARQHG